MGRIIRTFAITVGVVVLIAGTVTTASAQPLGTFRWQLSPFCNVLALTVTQVGGIYRLEGTDDHCGAARGAVVGIASMNTDGTVGFGLTIITPGASATHLDITLTIATMGGTWRDNGGHAGTIVFNPPAPGGAPRPGITMQIPDGAVTTAKLADGAVDGSRVQDGSLGAADVMPTQIQRRVTGACPSGQFMQSVNQDGTVSCNTDGTGSGDVTAVTAGGGLTGGGTSGDINLAVAFAGTGATSSAARSDHTHPADIESVSAGAGLTGGGTTGAVSLAVQFAGTGTEVTAARSDHAHAGMGDITAITAGTGLAGGAASGDATLNVAFAGSGAATTAARSDHAHAGMGDITAITAGTGLAGGAASGDATLNVAFAGSGAATTAARSDHAHTGMGDITGVAAGTGLTGGAAVGDATLNVSFGGSGAASLAARSDHYHPAPGSGLSTAIGQGTLGLNTGSQNVAVGDYAMATHTSGGDNVAIGMNSMRDNTTGSGNVAMGSGALYFSAGGSGNVAIGRQAMVAAIAHNSVAIGNEAMKNMSGTYNIGIGMWAGDWTVQGDNNIYIAHPGVQGSAGESNRIRIGFSAVHTHAFIAGIRGTTTGANDAVPVLIDSAGQLGTVSSSRRFKQDIAPLGDSSRAVQLLRPVQFRYSNPFGDGSKPVQFGLIAEEVAEIYPELVAHSADGQIETVKYHVLPTLLLAEVQRLERERAAMAQELAELKAMVARLLPNP